jgi:serine/threonine protein kinase
MICTACGTDNPANHGFCSSCGNSLRATSSLSTKGGGAAAAARPAPDDDLTVSGIILPPVPAAEVGTLTPPGATPPPLDDGTTAQGPWATGRAAKAADEVDFGPRYRLGRILGEGGMGAVYKAYDRELDRTVALKLVRPGLADNPTAVQRFKQELLLASKITHKNVLRIHDLGEFGGTRFISMALIEGEDLHHLLTRLGKLPLERALTIARQLCAGLDAAHSEGVVHRDLKPQNILLDSEEHAYISDFGLSKSFESDLTGMTRSGEMLGTPRYMAPEQVKGGKIDNRADLYALGLILYEMVTGDIPFQADSTVQFIYKHVHEQPRDPRELNKEVPEWLARVIMKCLEKDPGARYASASEILEAIDTATAPPPSKARKRPTTQVRKTLPAEPAGIWPYWKYAAVAILVVGDAPCRRIRPTSRSLCSWQTLPTTPATAFSTARWNQCSTSPWKAQASSTPSAAVTRASLPGNCQTRPRSSMSRAHGW